MDLISFVLLVVFMRFTLSAIPGAIVDVIYGILKIDNFVDADIFYGWFYSVIIAMTIIWDIDIEIMCVIALTVTVIKTIFDYSKYKK